MKKSLKIFAAAAAMTLVSSLSVYAGEWGSDAKGWWYSMSADNYYKGGVFTINGVSYGFDTDGYLKTGWFQIPGRSGWYYADSNGVIQTGWIQSDGKYYYCDPAQNGQMKQNAWLDDNGERYYFGDNGAMKQYEEFTVKNSEGQLFCYSATQSGAIIRDKEVTESDGTIFKYFPDGAMWYKSATSKDALTGSDNDWNIYYGGDEKQKQQVDQDKQDAADRRKEVIQNNIDKAEEKMNDYYVKYKAIGYSGNRSAKIERWETNVKNGLSKYLDEDQLKQYISAVKAGTYKSSQILYTEDEEEDDD